MLWIKTFILRETQDTVFHRKKKKSYVVEIQAEKIIRRLIY